MLYMYYVSVPDPVDNIVNISIKKEKFNIKNLINYFTNDNKKRLKIRWISKKDDKIFKEKCTKYEK